MTEALHGSITPPMSSVANSVQGSLKLFADFNKFKRLEIFNNSKAESEVTVAQFKLEESRTRKDLEGT